jgi:L-threonylcarbamoyladenylate synthase
MPENIWNDKNLIKILLENGIVIMPTDTIYGIVGKALEKNVTERIYGIKKRNPEKPCIILIGGISEIEKFGIKLTQGQEETLKKYWPGPVSVILDCEDSFLEYLHRGTKTLALRLPSSDSLRNLLIKTGPLIATSANPEDSSPAQTIEEAKKYFGNLIDLYLDGGISEGKHSKLIKLNKDGFVTVLRE